MQGASGVRLVAVLQVLVETKYFTKKQLQDENVRLGLARCDNELKSKTIAKLRAHLLEVKEKTPVHLENAPAHLTTDKRRPIPKKIRGAAWIRCFGDSLNGHCYCCRRAFTAFDDWHAGHIIPRAAGGSDSASNLRPVCGSCNHAMGAEHMDEFKARCYPE